MNPSSEKLYSEITVDLETGKEVGLTESEYYKVLEILGRTPTYTELGVFGVMWSEHCSYKNSIKQLKTLPRSGGRLLVEAGAENAGLMDIGGGYAVCFKIESHNHPSAIEPFQGAATGVGGILRDIFSMGARPIAALNALRFGEPDSARTKYLVKGVVDGIGHYGNCFGVPTVGGEVFFDDRFFDNPLINAMAVGIVPIDKTASATASGVGNPVFIVGSSTGRDGIHGASLLASREFDEKTDDMRPTVQVGDPFAEKKLLEATLELIEAGVVVGVQDMGAAGISCSTSEMSERGGVGMDVDLDLTPLREDDMSAYEIMLSESQERMLFVIDSNKTEKAKEICDNWDVPITRIGTVTDGGLLKVWRKGEYVCEIPADTLVLGGGAPVYDPPAKRPDYLDEANNFDLDSLKKDLSNTGIFWNLINSPVIASKRWVYEQYDSQVQANTVSIKGDAAVVRIKELPGKALAMTTDCNSRFVYLDPYKGAMAAVAEAARNVVCVGAKPAAITNCLNFGNPYDERVYWTFKEAVRGMGDACRAFDTPVTGGNVSFHNESQNRAVYPSPVIGMVGVIDDLEKRIGAGFVNVGDEIFLLGRDREELGGSEYLKRVHGKVVGKAPELILDEEIALQKAVLEAIEGRLLSSAHDASEGGLAICLAEKAIFSDKDLGCEIDGLANEIPTLFGESNGRIVVSCKPENSEKLIEICEKFGAPSRKLGKVTEEIFKVASIETDVAKLRVEYEKALPELMGE